MQRLIYISTARTTIATSELDRILSVSRRNNAAAGVTGLLVAGEQRFLQALEGEEKAVDATFARIAEDPRHFAVVTLRRDTIETRAFPDWTMGYVRGGPATTPAGATLREIVEALVTDIDNPGVRAYFTGFAEVNERK